MLNKELSTKGMQANDPTERYFAILTDILCSGDQINLASSGGIGLMWYYNDIWVRISIHKGQHQK